MNPNKQKLELLKKQFLNNWVVKKSKNPFKRGKRKPAFYCRKITLNLDNTFSFGNGTVFKTGNLAPDPSEFLETVSKEEAQRLNKIFYETTCSLVLDSEEVELKGCHFREDNGQEKIGYRLDNYQIPLYRLRFKYPDSVCSAYKCPSCQKIHIGKKQNL